ncbi:MAG: TetR/AcrR family transcriptional regulator [Spirochaetales bacterium]|nr:TetR/AcrR family transcriptional regulator [Spirochaetales bacterium]
MTETEDFDTQTTKEKIFTAAVRLFAERGFHGTSIRELAREVGIKESSVYNHFPGKNAIMQAILDYHRQGFQTASEELTKSDLPFDDTTDPVEFWMMGAAEFLKHQPPLSQQISIILTNEMYLNKQCRKFFLDTMFDIQKVLTENILREMYSRGMIIDCDFRKTAEQYVYFIQGISIETNLMLMDGKNEAERQQHLFEHIALFIGRLKKQ